MKLYVVTDTQVNVGLSAAETEAWARGCAPADGHWPCSELSGRRLFAAFDTNGIVELEIDGGHGDQDVDHDELYACLSDYLRGDNRLPADHFIWDFLQYER